MKVLLDTQILLAAIETGTRALSAQVKRILVSPEADIYVSVASLWEIAIKWRLKKLDLAQPPEKLPELIAGIGMGLLVISADHALASVAPEPLTRDPFDRLLIAQCKIESMQLLTIDRALAVHPLALKLN